MRPPPPSPLSGDAEDPKSPDSAEEEESKLSEVGLVLLIVFWYSSSVVAITTSKVCMTIVRVPFFLCFAQFLSAAALTGALSRVVEKEQVQHKPHVRREKLCGVFKIACVFSCGFVLTNVAFSMASAPFVETLKAAEPVSTALLAGLLLGEFESLKTYLALVAIVLGVASATATTTSTTGLLSSIEPATVVVLCSNVCFSLRGVFTKRLRLELGSAAGSNLRLFHEITRMALIPTLLLVLCIPAERDFVSRALLGTNETSFLRFYLALALNGAAYTSYNLSSFLVLSRVSTTSHAVLNVFRRVVVITSATLYFQTDLSLRNTLGVLLACAGVSAYALSKNKTPSSSSVGPPNKYPHHPITVARGEL